MSGTWIYTFISSMAIKSLFLYLERLGIHDRKCSVLDFLAPDPDLALLASWARDRLLAGL